MRPTSSEFVTDLIIYVGSPCLAFISLSQSELHANDFMIITGAGLGVMLGVGLIALPILRLLGAPSSVFLPPIMFMNAGNMGMPFALYAFGEAGLSLQVVLYSLGAFLQSSLGVFLVSRKQGAWEFLRLPIVYATVLGGVFNFFDLKLPTTIMRPIELLAAITIPLMLLTLGLKLSTIRLHAMRLPVIAALMRIGLGFLVGLAIALLIGGGRLESRVILLYAALPPAVVNFVYAEKFSQNADQVAATVMMGTLISMVTSPLVLYLAYQF